MEYEIQYVNERMFESKKAMKDRVSIKSKLEFSLKAIDSQEFEMPMVCH